MHKPNLTKNSLPRLSSSWVWLAVMGSVTISGCQLGQTQLSKPLITPEISPTLTLQASMSPQIKPTTNPASAKPSAKSATDTDLKTNQTVDWQTYSSSKYNYQVSIPLDWTKLSGPPEVEEVFNFRKDGVEINLNLDPTSAKTIQEYLKQKDKTAQTAWEGTPNLKVISTKLTKINDYSVVQREEEWLAAAFGRPVINTYFLKNGHVYSISLRYVGSESSSGVWSESEKEIYRQVLSKFRLVN